MIRILDVGKWKRLRVASSPQYVGAPSHCEISPFRDTEIGHVQMTGNKWVPPQSLTEPSIGCSGMFHAKCMTLERIYPFTMQQEKAMAPLRGKLVGTLLAVSALVGMGTPRAAEAQLVLGIRGQL